MPRPCALCISPSRSAIERDILQLRSPTLVGRRWALHRKSVSTHRDAHMDPMAAVDLDADTSTLTRVEDLTHRLETMLSSATSPTAYSTVARELRQSLELLARLRRELDERPQIAILTSTEWLATRALVFAALQPFPEARAAVAAALLDPDSTRTVAPRTAIRALPDPKDQGKPETPPDSSGPA
jgi:hypothetical protein